MTSFKNLTYFLINEIGLCVFVLYVSPSPDVTQIDMGSKCIDDGVLRYEFCGVSKIASQLNFGLLKFFSIKLPSN